MNENEMTINGVEYVRKSSIPCRPKIGDVVIIRTHSAGVHIGEYNIENWKNADSPVVLNNARRLWRWRGANSLNEVAMLGVNRDEYTRISKPVIFIKIVPIEIIPTVEGLDFSEIWND